MLIINFSSKNSFTNEDDIVVNRFTKMMSFKHNIVYRYLCVYIQTFHRYSSNNNQTLFCTCQALQSSVSCSFAIFILVAIFLVAKGLILPCFYFSIIGRKGFVQNIAGDAYYIVFYLAFDIQNCN